MQMRRRVHYGKLREVTLVWSMIGAVTSFVPIAGPIYAGSLFINGLVGAEVPFIAVLAMAVGVTLGHYVTAYLVFDDYYAFGEIVLLGSACLWVWCQKYYESWSARKKN
jgi:hypothetical protein